MNDGNLLNTIVIITDTYTNYKIKITQAYEISALI